MEKFLSSLYNYKLMSNDPKKESIEIKSLVKVKFVIFLKILMSEKKYLELFLQSTGYKRTSFHVIECKHSKCRNLNNKFNLEEFCGDVFTIGSGNHVKSFCKFTLRTTNYICFIKIISSNWFVFFPKNKINNSYF